MHLAVVVPALTLALAVSGPAFAQSTTGAPNSAPPSSAANQQKTKPQSALTIERVTQDLQKAGFTDVKVLEDAFLVQAKTKDGNPIVMSIGPNGLSALEVSNPNPSGASQPQTTGQAPPSNKPASAPSNGPASTPAKPAQH